MLTKQNREEKKKNNIIDFPITYDLTSEVDKDGLHFFKLNWASSSQNTTLDSQYLTHTVGYFTRQSDKDGNSEWRYVTTNE